LTTEFWITQTFNGLSYGALLFLLASGLSLIFGVMRIVNLAHGSYFLLGGYVGLSVVWRTHSFVLALLVGALAIALLGVGTLRFPRYRLFIMLVAVVIGAALWLALDRTRAGAMIRAAVDDAEMAQGVGIRVPTVSMGVFALGAFLAALGGVIGGGFLGVYPGLDFEILPYAFVVVIVGGLGSLPGAMVGSLLVGLLDNFGKALFPELAYFTLFAPMALILALRPTGLFGRT
jgi:branched-chain amino acid transport system permease protein